MSDAFGVPIVRLSVEGMKHQIVAALSSYALQLDEQVRQAVEDYCKPENLEQVIKSQVTQAINRAVQEEVERFYRVGYGREVIRQAVAETLGPRG